MAGPLFRDRIDAGTQLAGALKEYADNPRAIVLALPRGGVPVAAVVAKALHAPLDIFLVRKLGAPGHEEYAFGAITEDGARVVHYDAVGALSMSAAAIEAVAARELARIDEQRRTLRGGRPHPPLAGRDVILIDDGLATGATMQAAVEAIKRLGAASVIAAVPVGARDSCERLARIADRVVCLRQPEPFSAVGQWYQDFSETTDDEVRSLLG